MVFKPLYTGASETDVTHNPILVYFYFRMNDGNWYGWKSEIWDEMQYSTLANGT